jgi:hypothetical protein
MEDAGRVEHEHSGHLGEQRGVGEALYRLAARIERRAFRMSLEKTAKCEGSENSTFYEGVSFDLVVIR